MLARSCIIIAFSVWLAATVAVAQQPPDHYYSIPGIPFEVEKRRLTEAALELRKHPEKVVYLLGYSEKGKGKTPALRRLSLSRRFLIKKQHIAAARIITVYSGEKVGGVVMDIWIVDKNAPMTFKKKPEAVAVSDRSGCPVDMHDILILGRVISVVSPPYSSKTFRKT
ncbi:MAG TPA: hypothetical protein VEV84_06065 [Pyrinomonadaceae bacterium]|nr:hypothetical protein [Pyrinomonadaceae bacterium]